MSSTLSWTNLVSQAPSTGEVPPSTQSKTKDNADHAGPSHLSAPLRELTTLPLEPSLNSLSSSSLTAPVSDTETSDAMEVSRREPSLTTSLTAPSPEMLTHTLPRMDHANTTPSPTPVLRSPPM